MSQTYPPQYDGQPLQPQYPQRPQYPQQTPMYAPQTPLPQNARKPRRWPWIIALIIVYFIGMGVGSSTHNATTDTTTPTTTASSTTQSGNGTVAQPTVAKPTAQPTVAKPTAQPTVAKPTAQPTAVPTSNTAHLKLNETVAIDNTWQVTVISAKTNPGDGEINIPAVGNTYVLITVSLKNISDKQQTVSSLLQFGLRGTDGTNYNEDITYGNSPDGTVAVGDPLKGTLAYEVPANTKAFVLNFESGLLSDQVSWDITV
jgi:Domain of unknown function (DUF4352)